jgi:hypothetical protein
VVTVGGKMSDKNLKQWINIKFCVKVGKTASETVALLTVAYAEYGMKKSSVLIGAGGSRKSQKMHKMTPTCGQPRMQRTDANVDEIHTLVCSERILGVRLIVEELNMNIETVQHIIIKDLGMRKISAKMVPRILTNDQKRQIHISSDLLHNAEIFDGVLCLSKIKICPEGTKVC